MYKVNYYYSNIKSFFHNDNPKETVGIIGYLRGDFASNGIGFHTTWFDVHEELKTLKFKTEFDDVINELRNGILKDRSSMKKVFSNHPNCVMNSEAGISRGVFVETEHYEYAFRLIGDKGNYDFYCYCADKNVQPSHLRNARRFRNENGQLAKTIEEVSKLTQAEALNYYTDGDRYESGGNIYTFRKSGMHMSFVSETGGETEVHPDKLGTFLPDVEYLGMSFTGNVYARLNELLALTEESGKYTKYAGSVKEYSISNMRIEFENAEFAQGNAEKNLNGTVYIDVEIPVRFGGRELVPIQFTMRVKASYIPKF